MTTILIQAIIALSTAGIIGFLVWCAVADWQRKRRERKLHEQRSLMRNPRIIVGTVRRGRKTKTK